MCLIITGKSAKVRSTLLNTAGMLADIYTSNSDGVGVMYGTSKGLKVCKTLPKSVGDVQSFIERLPTDDREIALHFRWTTHGDTDMINCHPYDVVAGYVAMMHNGILSTGNAADTTKSDTWHFIKDYLESPIHEHPPLIHNEGFLTMIADYIGDNRFVFMDGDGRMSHVNYDQGIEHDGLWFSNTYAWTPSKLIPNYYKTTKYNNRYTSAYAQWGTNYDDEYEMEDYNASFGIKPRTISAHDPKFNEDDYEWEDEAGERIVAPSIDDLGEYIMQADTDSLEACLEMMPMTTINTLFMYYVPEPTTYCTSEELSSYEEDIYKAVGSCDMAALHDFVMNGKSAGIIADVICYYFDWTPKQSQRLLLPAML